MLVKLWLNRFLWGQNLFKRTCLKVATFWSSGWNCVGIFLWSSPWELGWVSRGKTHGNVGVSLRFKLVHLQLLAIKLFMVIIVYFDPITTLIASKTLHFYS